MSWEWSHSNDAYENAYQNLHDLDRETLCTILAEWDMEIFNEGEYEKYDERHAALMNDPYETCETLADQIWLQCSESQEMHGEWFGRTCDNGGFNAWVCPNGCHTVSFDRNEED